MIYFILKIVLNKFFITTFSKTDQITSTWFISTASFCSKIKNNEINNIYIHFLETEFYNSDRQISLEESLHRYIDKFLEKGYIFSLIDEFNISTIFDEKYMTYDYYSQHPMLAFELKLNMILAKNPHLIYSPNRSHNHPLFRKFSHIPFNN